MHSVVYARVATEPSLLATKSPPVHNYLFNWNKGRPRLRFKDYLKRNITLRNIDHSTWCKTAHDRTTWRAMECGHWKVIVESTDGKMVIDTCNHTWIYICEAASPNQWHVDKFQNDFFCIFENVNDLASRCKKNDGAAAKIGKVMKDCVQKG